MQFDSNQFNLLEKIGLKLEKCNLVFKVKLFVTDGLLHWWMGVVQRSSLVQYLFHFHEIFGKNGQTIGPSSSIFEVLDPALGYTFK